MRTVPDTDVLPSALISPLGSPDVEREEKREAFLRDAINAWNEYQVTGLHATLEDADAWLSKPAHGEDTEPPECHV